MKKSNCSVVTLIMMLFLFASITEAKIWVVNNNAGAPGDFTELNQLNDDSRVVSGDTVYVIGSGQVYGNVGIRKQLVIFGPGYFLGQNPDNQAKPVDAKINGFSFYSGSEGSIISGLHITGGYVFFDVGNITVKRCRINYNTSSEAVYIDDGVNNVTITQCHIVNNSTYSTSKVIEFDQNANNVIISNCFIDRVEYGNIQQEAIYIPSTSSAEITNCVIRGNMTLNNSIFQDNIIRDGELVYASSTIQNNISNYDQLPVSNGNQIDIDMSTVFAGGSSADGQWQLADNSPAIGAGVVGGDLGMFGGNNSYVLSGIPSIPLIYYFAAPTTGSPTSGLQVDIKVKGHN